jgi:hypothetical protein
MNKILFFLLLFFLISCDNTDSKKETEELKKRIKNLEDKSFCEAIAGKNSFCRYM